MEQARSARRRTQPGTGSVYRITKPGPDGRRITVGWMAQVSDGPRGDRTFLRARAATRDAARAKLPALRADLAQRRLPPGDPSRLSLGDYLRQYIDKTLVPAIGRNTKRGYEAILLHVAPIAHIPLGDVTSADIEDCVATMTTHRYRAKSKRPASPKTRRNVQIFLRSAFKDALERGYIGLNPGAPVKLARVERRKQWALTPDDARALLEAVKGDRYEAAFRLYFVGVRLGEALGLARSEVDLDAATVDLGYRLERNERHEIERVQLKSAASEDRLPLPPFVVEGLRAHVRRWETERASAGVDPAEDGLLFVTERGLPVNQSWLSKRFTKLANAAGFGRHVTPHMLRHGTATLLVAGNVHPRVVSEIERHASVAFTMDAYTHVHMDQKIEAMQVLQSLIVPPGDSHGDSQGAGMAAS